MIQESLVCPFLDIMLIQDYVLSAPLTNSLYHCHAEPFVPQDRLREASRRGNSCPWRSKDRPSPSVQTCPERCRRDDKPKNQLNRAQSQSVSKRILEIDKGSQESKALKPNHLSDSRHHRIIDHERYQLQWRRFPSPFLKRIQAFPKINGFR
jgi:hypothetical protein